MDKDILRQVTVASCAVLAIVGGFIGSGAAGGTPIAEAAGGALSSDATLIAPDGPAFSIWSAIYLGLIAYAVWQFLPSQRSAARQRRLGYPVAASLLLNAAWILSIQADLLWLSVLVIVALVAVLSYAFIVMRRLRSRGAIEALVVDGTIGLYLGWVCVATAANIAAVLVASDFDGWGLAAELWALCVLAAVGIIGVLLVLFGKGRIAPSLAICWGLGWVAVGRLAGDLVSESTAVGAIVVAVAVLAATVVFRLWAGRSAGIPSRAS